MRTFILSIVSCLSIFFFSCSPEQPVKKKFSLTDTIVPINPNGDSELAKLMRDMTDYMVKTKNNIIAGDSLLPYPAEFAQLHTAQATPGMVDEQTMRLMGSTYLAALKDLYAGKPTERKEYYNAAVNACITCHQSVCPGPLKRIGKLAIPL